LGFRLRWKPGEKGKEATCLTNGYARAVPASIACCFSAGYEGAVLSLFFIRIFGRGAVIAVLPVMSVEGQIIMPASIEWAVSARFAGKRAFHVIFCHPVASTTRIAFFAVDKSSMQLFEMGRRGHPAAFQKLHRQFFIAGKTLNA